MPQTKILNYSKSESGVNNMFSNFKHDKQEKRSTSKKEQLISLLRPTFPSLLPNLLRFIPFRITYSYVNNSKFIPKQLKQQMGYRIRKALTSNQKWSESFTTGKALVIYYSNTGNTRKAAQSIAQGCKKAGLQPTIKQISEALDTEFYDFDILCIGTPVKHGLPPPIMMKFMLKRGTEYRKRKEVRLNMKKIPGKNALVFVTYSGPHVGISEAVPAGKYLKQELEHLGFNVLDEWYIIGEFHGWKEANTSGKLGDIQGRPNVEDLSKIEEKTKDLVNLIKR